MYRFRFLKEKFKLKYKKLQHKIVTFFVCECNCAGVQKKMILKLKNEFIRADKCIGPMPNFYETFEKFFIEKSAALIYGANQRADSIKDENDPDGQLIVSFEPMI